MCIINNTILLTNFLQMEKRLRDIALAIHKCEKAIEKAIDGKYINGDLIIDFMQKKIEKLIDEQEQIKARPMWSSTVYEKDFNY